MNFGIDVADLLDRLVRFHEEEHLEAGGPNPVGASQPASEARPSDADPPVAASTPSLSSSPGGMKASALSASSTCPSASTVMAVARPCEVINQASTCSVRGDPPGPSSVQCARHPPPGIAATT
jgi:hypothetical protein